MSEMSPANSPANTSVDTPSDKQADLSAAIDAVREPNMAEVEPDQAVSVLQLQQFSHWWRENYAGFHAGPAISQMWRSYPFGALLLDETWAWWPLVQVSSEAKRQATQAGHPCGLVVASAPSGVAVLDWPEGARGASCLHLVAYAGMAAYQSGNGPLRASISPERFLSSKGFDQPDRVIACAFFERSAASRTPFAPSNHCRPISSESLHESHSSPGRALTTTASLQAYRSRRTGMSVTGHAPRARSAVNHSPSLA